MLAMRVLDLLSVHCRVDTLATLQLLGMRTAEPASIGVQHARTYVECAYQCLLGTGVSLPVAIGCYESLSPHQEDQQQITCSSQKRWQCLVSDDMRNLSFMLHSTCSADFMSIHNSRVALTCQPWASATQLSMS
jgi:hypothetical protein